MMIGELVYERVIRKLQTYLDAAKYCGQRSGNEEERAYWQGYEDGLRKALKILEDYEFCSGP